MAERSQMGSPLDLTNTLVLNQTAMLLTSRMGSPQGLSPMDILPAQMEMQVLNQTGSRQARSPLDMVL